MPALPCDTACLRTRTPDDRRDLRRRQCRVDLPRCRGLRSTDTTTLPVAPGDRRERPPLTSRITFATPAEARAPSRAAPALRLRNSRAPLRASGRRARDLRPRLRRRSTNLARIDRLTIALPLGFTSVAYHLVPQRANGRLLIYHNGHRQDLDAGKADDRVLPRARICAPRLLHAVRRPEHEPGDRRDPLRPGRARVRAAPESTTRWPASRGRIATSSSRSQSALNYARRLGYSFTGMIGPLRRGLDHHPRRGARPPRAAQLPGRRLPTALRHGAHLPRQLPDERLPVLRRLRAARSRSLRHRQPPRAVRARRLGRGPQAAEHQQRVRLVLLRRHELSGVDAARAEGPAAARTGRLRRRRGHDASRATSCPSSRSG